MLACSYCVSVDSPAGWDTALIGRGSIAVLAGVVAAVVAMRSVGRRRTGATLAAFSLLVVLPATALLGRTTVDIEVATTRPPSDAPMWRVSCRTVFRSSPGSDPWITELEQACRDATVLRRVAVGVLAVTAAIVVVVGGVLASGRGRSHRVGPRPA